MASAVACATMSLPLSQAASRLPCSAALSSPHCAYSSSRAPRAGGSDSSGSRARRQRQWAVAAAAAAPGPSSSQHLAVSSTFEQYILDLQKRIIQGAEELDGSGARFQHDRWTRNPDNPNAGYGIASGGWVRHAEWLWLNAAVARSVGALGAHAVHVWLALQLLQAALLHVALPPAPIALPARIATYCTPSRRPSPCSAGGGQGAGEGCCQHLGCDGGAHS
jgi:hypothetical protein